MAEARNFPKTITGHEIPIRTTTDHVTYTDREHPNGMTLTYKLDTLNEEAKAINNIEDENKIKFSKKDYADNVPYKKFTIINHKGRSYMSLKDITSIPPRDNSGVWLPLSRRRKNKCLIEEVAVDGNPKERKFISDEGYTFDDLSAMLRNNDYHRYIQNGDYIKIVNYLGYVLTLVANIDTYYNYKNPTNPHNIDFICTKIENLGGARDHGSNLSWFDLDPNISTNQFIASGVTPMNTKTFMGPSWSMDRQIDQTTTGVLTEEFARHIVDKYKTVTTRKYDKNNNTIENLKDYGVQEINLGKSWFLYEGEIKGYNGMSSINDMMTCTQYPIFQKYINRVFKYNDKYLGILTSSPVFDYNPLDFQSAERPDTSNMNIICIRNNISQVYSQALKGYVFPMFGMRFV
jgi:hypothetical protein